VPAEVRVTVHDLLVGQPGAHDVVAAGDAVRAEVVTAAASRRPAAGTVAAVRDLHVTFPAGDRPVRAVRGVDLAVEAGEVVALVGESGSGKTVLGLSLLGLLPPQAHARGQVRVGDVDMLTAPEPLRRRVRRNLLGAVFQDPLSSLTPTMRIGDQVAEVAGSAAEAVRLLEAAGVADAEERMRQYPHELSGGLRQRVMIAIAVAGSPRLLIADEPTTALDVTVQAQVLRLLRRLCDDIGCAVLLVTHDLGVAATVADRICVMYAGRVMEAGGGAAVLARPAHPYTSALLSSRLRLSSPRGGSLVSIGGEPPDPRVPVPGCPFTPRCPAATEACGSGEPPPAIAAAHGGVSACIHPGAAAVAWPSRPEEAPRSRPAAPTGGVTVEDVVVRHRRGRGHVDALRGVSLDVAPGEAVAVVGESGCGKTTLLRVIAGLTRPTAGRITLAEGTSPLMIFQDPGSSLTPWLSVGELVADRVRRLPAAERDARVRRALASVGLPAETAWARPPQLSGGQRQRVAIARVIVDDCRLLLCDEPISALDASLAAGVLNLIRRLRRQLGMAVVFVTHDLAAARHVGDRMLVMRGGEVVESGPVERVVGSPETAYTRELIAAVPGRGRWR
jgi:peptide/nickel transport system ATP-binding protein